MGFLKRLFGSGGEKEYVDKQGIYFYIQCAHCGSRARVRADKQYDLNREGDGFVWHKTIVDNRCFRPMRAVVHLGSNYEVTEHTIDGGRFLAKEEYDALATAGVGQTTDKEA